MLGFQMNESPESPQKWGLRRCAQIWADMFDGLVAGLSDQRPVWLASCPKRSEGLARPDAVITASA